MFQQVLQRAVAEDHVLDQRGIAYEASFTGTYKKLEYCVQYRETDFNFISRLMEQYGIKAAKLSDCGICHR